MVLFNRFSLAPIALGSAAPGVDSVFRAAGEVAHQFAGQLGVAAGPAGAAAGYGEFTRATARTTDEGVTLEVLAPGFGPDDVELTVKRDEVTVQGARGEREDGRAAHRFARTWRLGFPIDAERASARVENGILTVVLPRHASAQPRSIAVEGARPVVDDDGDVQN